MRRDRTWIVIADAAHVTAMESVAGEPHLQDVADMHLSATLPATHDLVTDRAGRSFESQGRTRHAKEGRSDPHRELKRAFAKQIAALLASKLAEKRFEHLILIAPPVTLGDLRAVLSKSTRARIRAELPHDLIKMPPRKLRPHLLSALSAGRAAARRETPRPRAPSGPKRRRR